MQKNIILCSDGTGNGGGNGDVTNIWRIYNAIDMAKTESISQVAMHDDGVGTQTSTLLKIIGGIFGYGLKRNVHDLYLFLIRNYEQDLENQIYIFGFSRGAYTARVLAELISLCGIIDPTNKTDAQVTKEINEAFEILTDSILKSSDNTTFVGNCMAKFNRYVRGIKLYDRKEFITKKCYPIKLIEGNHENSTPYLIRFLGVWDTVSAYGFPIESMANFWNRYIYPYKFSDRRLHPYIRKAAHALSIDEERETFQPMLFDQSQNKNIGLPADRVEQVWFAGVHANVGGGYPKDGLAYISLNWMMDKAEQELDGLQGLQFIRPLRKQYASRINPSAKKYDSRSGLAVFYRYKPRDIAQLCQENGIYNNAEQTDQAIKIHSSVVERVLARTENYAPGNIPNGSILEAGSPQNCENVMASYRQLSCGPNSRFSDVEPLIKLRMRLQWFKYVMLAFAIIVAYKSEVITTLVEFGILKNHQIKECSDGLLLPLGQFLSKIFPLLPTGEWVHNVIVMPILSCNSIALVFIFGSFAVWFVGYKTKQMINTHHSNFWNSF